MSFVSNQIDYVLLAREWSDQAHLRQEGEQILLSSWRWTVWV